MTYLALSTNTKVSIPEVGKGKGKGVMVKKKVDANVQKEKKKDVVKKKDGVPRKKHSINYTITICPERDEALQDSTCLEKFGRKEVTDAMAETMEQYMRKTRADYGSGVVRPKIEDKDNFELKGQFLKELRTNTFSGSDHEDVNEHTEKVLDIVDLFHIHNITIYQVMLRAFPMSLTGSVSSWLRNKPSGSITTWEDLKTKFLRKYCPPARIAKKMEEINNFQKEPDEKLYQAWERFKELLMKCPQHYLTEMQEVVLCYIRLDVPTRQILDSRRAIPSKTVADSKVSIQEMAEYSQKWHNETSRPEVPTTLKISHSKKKGKPSKKLTTLNLVHLFKEGDIEQLLRDSTKGTMQTLPSTDAAIRNQGASIKTLEIQIGQMSKVLQERGFGSLPSSTETNPRDHVKSISTIVEADASSIHHIGSHQYAISTEQNRAIVSVMPLSTYLNFGLGKLAYTKLTIELANRTVKYPKGIAENVLAGIGKFVFPIDFIIIDMPEDIKVLLILRRPFLSTAHAKIDVYKRKITLRVREERIIFISVKPASSLIKRVYMLSLRERMELDLEARLMGETLVINRSLDPFFEDYIELNDLNVPLELRKNQADDLMRTIKEGEVIEEFRTRNDARMDSKVFGYPSDCDHDKKIHIDCACNLKFSCMIGFEFLHANFFPILYVNVMTKKFHNSIIRDKMEYKGNNVVGTLMNIPIIVGTFSILTDFVVLEDMDAYRDEGMSDVIFGEPFLREVGINAKRFEGMITIYNGNDEVTYQMVRSHPRFKNRTNEQCNKIPPLLKVSKDKRNGISHAYQKLKGFYKRVLNLGPDYIRDAKMEEWLTRGHISVHEYQDRNALVLPIFYTGPHERNIDEVGRMNIFCWAYAFHQDKASSVRVPIANVTLFLDTLATEGKYRFSTFQPAGIEGQQPVPLHGNRKVLRVDLTGDEDPTDEDGDTGMGDSTGVLVSLGSEYPGRGRNSWE
ncbi:putative reverse transcriptase domain-containing protein [Tanacetum coccineum]